MPNPKPAEQRITEAQAEIAAARAEVKDIPPAGRERTAIILRARKHANAALRLLRPIVSSISKVGKTATDDERARATALIAEAEDAWPPANYGKGD